MRINSLLALVIMGPATVTALSQVTADIAKGLSPFATYSPNDIDNVNPVNGNLFLKIPLVGFPQRGGKLRLDYYIYYNDKQWSPGLYVVTNSFGEVTGPIAGQWAPSGTMGVYVTSDQMATYGVTYNSASQTQGTGGDSYSITQTILDQYVATADGGLHYIGDGYQETCNTQGTGVCPALPSGYTPGFIDESYPATDSSGYDQYGHGPDGIKYGTNNGLEVNTSNTISDPNGNAITFSYSSGWTDTYGRAIPGSNSGVGATPFLNTLNSHVNLVPGIPTGVPSECPSGTSAARIWSVPASESYGNGTGTYYFCYTYMNFQTAFDLATTMPNSTYPYNVTEANQSTVIGGEQIGQAVMLTAIVLPDITKYTFSYDQYLSLTNITLPTGGSISYTWQNVIFAPYPLIPSPGAALGYGSITPISRALATRTVSPGNGQPSITTTYRWYVTANANAGLNGVQFPAYSVMTDSNGNDIEYTLGGNDDSNTNWRGFVATTIGYYSGCSPHDTSSGRNCAPASGTRLKSVTYVLTPVSGGGAASGTAGIIPQPFSIPPTVPTQVTSHVATSQGDILSMTQKTLAPGYGGSVSVFVYGEGCGNNSPPATCTYTASNPYTTGQTANVATYDFGAPGSGSPGSLLRTNVTQYQWQSSSSYLQANLLDLVQSSTTYSGTVGSQNWAAQTNYGYDESPSPPGALGNQTSVTRYISSTSTVKNTAQYNSNGVVTLATDALGTQTQYANFACNNALPQKITVAYGSTATTPEATNLVYDCNIGKATSSQDANSQTTTYSFADPLSRLYSVGYPDRGGFSVNYSDVSNPGAYPLTMTTTTLTGGAAGNEMETTTYDGLGRAYEKQLQTPSGASTVSTSFDNMGRIYSVTNPYYTTSDPTYGVTANSYDALGRVVKVTYPGGTFTQTCYDGIASAGQTNCSSYLGTPFTGTWVDSTDQNGNPWQRASDGLGRLKRVMEPSGSTQSATMQTDYGYDSLGDLTSVTQWGGTSGSAGARSRSFQYDSLERLTSATNPENGTTTYTYDSNGNVLFKTSPAVNASSGSQTIGFCYDALSRVTYKYYSATNNCPAPASFAASFTYDTSTVTGGQNLIGRLTDEKSYSGTTLVSERQPYSYDGMGRLLKENQINSFAGKTYAPAYLYDLAGQVIASTDGATPIQSANTQFPCTAPPTWSMLGFGLCYDNAGRVTSVTSNWAAYPINMFSIGTNPYDAAGQLQNWGQGPTSSGGWNLTVSQGYTNRLWLNSITATGQVP